MTENAVSGWDLRWEDTVGRIRRASRVCVFVDWRVPLAVGSAALLAWDRVLRAGASACLSRFAARSRRRFFALAVVDGGGTGFVSTLGDACVFTLGTRCVAVAFVLDRVVLQFSSRGACHGVL